MIHTRGLKSLEAKVKRLENALGKEQRGCPLCCVLAILPRRRMRHEPNAPAPEPQDLIEYKCEICSAKQSGSLAGRTENTRKALQLYYSFTREDRYTNLKACAIYEWFKQRVRIYKRRRSGGYAADAARDERRKGAAIEEETPEQQRVKRLLEEVRSFREKEEKRLQAKHGSSPFPELAELIKTARDRAHIEREHTWRGLEIIDMDCERIDYLVCAEMERIIWGEAFHETISAIEKIEQDIVEKIELANVEEWNYHEELRLKNLKFLNNNRTLCGLPPLPDDYGKESVTAP